MWKQVGLGVAIGVFAICAFAAKAWAGERVTLYLDWGFVGRPVSLDLFNDTVRIRWDAGDLMAPTILYVEKIDDGAARVWWTDPYHLSSRGVEITMPGECMPDGWTLCATSYTIDGSTWEKAEDNRVYGSATVKQEPARAAYMQSGKASWYKYKNCRCAASPDFPKGTRIRVRSKANPSKYTVVRINDYGPERNVHPDRVIDLDAVAFAELAPLGAGIISVSVEPITKDDPDYAMADEMPTP